MTDGRPRAGRRIELPSGVCHYREAGQGRPTVVLLHGLASDSRIYGCLQPLLADTVHTLAPDLLGWGFSEPNAGLTFGFDTIDRNLAQFIDAHRLDDVVLVGHEMTGPAAIRWAVANPGRTRGLVLLNSYWGWNSARMPPVLKALHVPIVGGVLRRAMGVMRSVLFGNLFRWQIGRIWGTHTPLSDELTVPSARRLRLPPSRAKRCIASTKACPPRSMPTNDGWTCRHSWQCRTLILWGGRDPYLRSHVARQFHRLIPNSELHLYHDAGHFVQVEAAVEAARAINAFIEGCRTEA